MTNPCIMQMGAREEYAEVECNRARSRFPQSGDPRPLERGSASLRVSRPSQRRPRGKALTFTLTLTLRQRISRPAASSEWVLFSQGVTQCAIAPPRQASTHIARASAG